MTSIVTLTSKNQITLPVKLVNFWNLAKGMKLEITIGSDVVQIKKTPDISSFQGYLANTDIGRKYTVEQVMEKARIKRASRIMKND